MYHNVMLRNLIGLHGAMRENREILDTFVLPQSGGLFCVGVGQSD